jgi:hypothetical protein
MTLVRTGGKDLLWPATDKHQSSSAAIRRNVFNLAQLERFSSGFQEKTGKTG